ncbi:amino acid adenylation domain-containing protein [Kitasatospora sp. GP82]|uniref:amino acid adenylation domain-containing protein n=1 Tax=Kitasatospora sp. GP82 TaxID=3035089 RepID=UPI002476D252|nr:amino acid adenylation domain-containing protein [Kitasatospora sp. GP82]MDH6128535.1 amino acid adenylation domain-containing protein [Kitasatospora sp. GP82]
MSTVPAQRPANAARTTEKTPTSAKALPMTDVVRIDSPADPAAVGAPLPDELSPENPLLHELFDERAARFPDQVAVRDALGSLTYAQLAVRSDWLAAELHGRCPQPGALVGLHLERGADVVVAMLAVLKSGHTYVPLDPGYPVERLLFTAQDARLGLIVSDQPVPAELAELPVLRLDELTQPGAPVPAPPVSVTADAPAYVIYTSGSTGRPKGVQVPHRNVVALVRACARRYELRHDDVWTLFHSYSFDFSVWEIWGALLSGGTLVVVPHRTAASPQATLKLLVHEGVTVFNVVPSVFRHLTRAARRTGVVPSTLRYVIFGGESVDIRDVRAWRAEAGRRTRFVNTYGITEATVFVTYRLFTEEELDRAADAPEGSAFALDIGEALDGWEMLVVGEDGAPVRPGETGEILVAGSGVALGYLHRPELTAERFPLLPVPGGGTRRHYRSGDLARLLPDGMFCYAGRADDQVKINGFRIELGEVEARLQDAPGVRELVVVRTVSRIGEPMLTAFYTTPDTAPPTDGERQELAERLTVHARRSLPAHMLPGRFVHLAELPVNPSGKTDRKALSAWQGQAPQPSPVG